ncbi:MAG: OmpA-like transrane domain [Proteobacteria bacterium]|nr:OmpA-like transrane domain [Pseudomonadota bacterium]
MRTPIALLLGLTLCLSALADEAPEDWQAKGQVTYVRQRSENFRSPYSGAHSLDASGEYGYTATATLFAGLRPWRGGEIYLNLEAGQGNPLSGLNGLGGFSNGEATRVSGNQLKAYRQRLFLRQTWNLGGDSEHVDSAINQLAGNIEHKRFVLTVGNFSALDIFDNNAYAKDPRSQFLNWSNMASTAYDYAADARGFGWGFAGEWYQDDWVFRFGRMSGPQEPNGEKVDNQILRHYGDQIELEHSHQIAQQPGKIRLLAWRNRAVLASFADASAWLDSHPGSDPEAISQVRNSAKIKYGFGLNIEQAINDQLGFFLRAMHADGRTETYAFTEADASLASGLALKGAAWGRADDTFGLAWMHNSLSRQRRDYLAKGGISFFIGDGALNYRPESIIETYYSWQVLPKLWLTGDFQHISNPAYNADRGPAKISSLRLHTEF